MDAAENQRLNQLLLERLPFVRDAWLETSRALDARSARPAAFYDDVLRRTMPQLVAEASAGSREARSRLQLIFAFTEELCRDSEGVALVQGGIMRWVLDAAARALDLVLELMGPMTRELFERAWGWEPVG